MFTGIVTAVGRIAHIDMRADAARIEVATGSWPLQDIALGDSIAVSGVCLTVVEIGAQSLSFDVSQETLRCTAGLKHANAAVNLEQAMRISDRIGGHLVTGHVDGVGTLVSRADVGEHVRMCFTAPAALGKFIARKGSIAVNGVSLTVNEAAGSEFEVNLIPHTLAQTNLQNLAAGSEVNLEVDMIARYVERMLEFRGA
jgi:riboflavin synthase